MPCVKVAFAEIARQPSHMHSSPAMEFWRNPLVRSLVCTALRADIAFKHLVDARLVALCPRALEILDDGALQADRDLLSAIRFDLFGVLPEFRIELRNVTEIDLRAFKRRRAAAQSRT